MMADYVDDVQYKSDTSVTEIQSFSDEVIVLWCEPCHFESDKQSGGVSYCPTCNSILCKLCDEAHSRLPLTKRHRVCRGLELPKSNADKPIKYSDCAVHPGNKNDHFCITHGKLVCSICAKKHRKQCIVKGISVLCRDLCDDDIITLKEDIRSARERINDARISLEKNVSDVKLRYHTLVGELDELRDQILSKLDQLFAETIANIKEECDRLSSDLADKFSTLSDAIHSLDQMVVDAEKTAI